MIDITSNPLEVYLQRIEKLLVEQIAKQIISLVSALKIKAHCFDHLLSNVLNFRIIMSRCHSRLLVKVCRKPVFVALPHIWSLPAQVPPTFISGTNLEFVCGNYGSLF